MSTINFCVSYSGFTYLPDGGKIGGLHINFTGGNAYFACISSQHEPDNQPLNFRAEHDRSMKVIEAPSAEVANTIRIWAKVFCFREPDTSLSYGLTETESSAKCRDLPVEVCLNQNFLAETSYHIQVVNTGGTLRAIVTIAEEQLAQTPQMLVGRARRMTTTLQYHRTRAKQSLEYPRQISALTQKILQASLLDALTASELHQRYDKERANLKRARQQSVQALTNLQNTQHPEIQKAIQHERECLTNVTALALALKRKRENLQTNASHT